MIHDEAVATRNGLADHPSLLRSSSPSGTGRSAASPPPFA